MVYRNHEGYPDPTAGEALETVTREEKEKAAEITSLVNIIKQIIGLAGFEMVGRITLKDKRTGKEYR